MPSDALLAGLSTMGVGLPGLRSNYIKDVAVQEEQTREKTRFQMEQDKFNEAMDQIRTSKLTTDSLWSEVTKVYPEDRLAEMGMNRGMYERTPEGAQKLAADIAGLKWWEQKKSEYEVKYGKETPFKMNYNAAWTPEQLAEEYSRAKEAGATTVGGKIVAGAEAGGFAQQPQLPQQPQPAMPIPMSGAGKYGGSMGVSGPMESQESQAVQTQAGMPNPIAVDGAIGISGNAAAPRPGVSELAGGAPEYTGRAIGQAAAGQPYREDVSTGFTAEGITPDMPETTRKAMLEGFPSKQLEFLEQGRTNRAGISAGSKEKPVEIYFSQQENIINDNIAQAKTKSDFKTAEKLSGELAALQAARTWAIEKGLNVEDPGSLSLIRAFREKWIQNNRKQASQEFDTNEKTNVATSVKATIDQILAEQKKPGLFQKPEEAQKKDMDAKKKTIEQYLRSKNLTLNEYFTLTKQPNPFTGQMSVVGAETPGVGSVVPGSVEMPSAAPAPTVTPQAAEGRFKAGKQYKDASGTVKTFLGGDPKDPKNWK